MGSGNENVVNMIVAADLCVGCGVCAAICPQDCLQMQMNRHGEYKPVVIGACLPRCNQCLRVCPFNDNDENEDSLGKSLFERYADIKHDATIGYYRKSVVGHVSNTVDRISSASGGMTSGVMKALLKQRLIDKAIVPAPTHRTTPLFAYRLAGCESDVDTAKGSVYYPLEASGVLRTVMEGPDLRYAMTVLPCFAKAIRLAQLLSPKLRERVRYLVGLTCGGCPNAHFTEVLACAAGIPRPEKVQYRSKHGSTYANDFRFVCKTATTVGKALPFDSLFGFLWANKMFFHRVCSLCDDVFAELGDICVMDAWLPECLDDPKGTCMVIFRNPDLEYVVTGLSSRGEFACDDISIDEILTNKFQLIRYKREDIKLRFACARALSSFVPSRMIQDDFQLASPPREAVVSFRCQNQAKDHWCSKRDEFLRSDRGGWALRLRCLIFCLGLYRQLTSAGVNVRSRRQLLVPYRLFTILRAIKRLALRR